MSNVFIIASTQKESEPGEGNPSGLVLSASLAEAHVSARRIREIHWMGMAGMAETIRQAGFLAETVLLTWSPSPLLEHYVLQSADRAVEAGERDLILLGQSEQEIACAVLLASPSAVGRYNLLPRARLAVRFTLTGGPEKILKALSEQLDKNAAKAAEAARVRQQAMQNAGGLPMPTNGSNMVIEETEEPADLPFPGDIGWVATDENLAVTDLQHVFPKARRLVALPPAPPGEWFLLNGLLRALDNSRERWGLLITLDEQGVCLATLVERL